MISIHCPNCNGVLEVPDGVVEGQHILCPYCNNKFSMPSGELKRSSGKSQEQIEADHRAFIYFELEKLRHSRDLKKFYGLFKISPLCIKVSSVLLLLEILTFYILVNIGQDGTKSVGAAVLYIWILGGILKGYKGCRTFLVVLKIIALICGVSLLTVAKDYDVTGVLGVLSFLISIPCLCLLFTRSSNSWFDGNVENVGELKKALSEDMGPTVWWKNILLISGIVVALLTIFVGVNRLMPMKESAEGRITNEDMRTARMLAIHKLSEEYSTYMKNNNIGKIFRDTQLLYARKNISDTRATLKDTKHFLLSMCSKVKNAKKGKVDDSTRKLDDILQAMNNCYYSQYCLVEQAEIIFYSELFNMNKGSDEDKKYYRRYYGELKSPSKSDVQAFFRINAEMIKSANELKLKLTEFSGE